MRLKSFFFLFFSMIFINFCFSFNENLYANSIVTALEQTKETAIPHPLPDAWMVLPFIVLLLMIATGPLFYKHFWERHYPKISIGLGLITIGYYYFILNDWHDIVHTMEEYISFIALLTSLFVASGGIMIKVDKKATPLLNSALLFIGAVISNLIGTTGASMLLIRPYLKINKNRIKPFHIVFFIFIVSNIGGALTPIGDPPLFLGFLRGVEFFWVIAHVWHIWLPTILVLLAIFYVIDSKVEAIEDEYNYSNKIEFKGLHNVVFLGIIILSVFLDKNVFSWVPNLHPLPLGIREIIMFSVAYFAYKRADKEALNYNNFNFEPIKEVAYLFVGIFATMIPALQLIAHEAQLHGKEIDAGIFYWATGILSSFLDNAPTYLNFLSAAMGKFNLDVNLPLNVLRFEIEDPLYLEAISVGAVFFGAMTYIGNGPNFMVKSISEQEGIKMPSFFGYMIKYSIPILIPIFTLIWLIFFYGRG